MDLRIKETGNGGDVILSGKDLIVIEGMQNMPYLSMFGGSLAASTPVRRLEGEQAFDFWGNTLLWASDPGLQMNSQTERTLNNTALTSAGLTKIEQAVIADLDHMDEFVNKTVEVSIIAVDKLSIEITLERPDNLQDKKFIYIWDATNSELSEVTYGNFDAKI